MNLSLNDLDPDVAQRLSENPRFAALHAATTAPARAPGGDKVLRAIKAVAMMLLVQAVCVMTSVNLQLKETNPNMAFLVGMLWIFAAPLGAFWWYRKGVVAQNAARPVSAPTVFADAPLALADLRDASGFMLDLPLSERAYLEAVVALWDATEAGTLAETEARDLVGQMNDLRDSDRALQAQAERLDLLDGDTDTVRLVSERDALAVRADRATDSDARATLAQTLALCETRLAQAREIAPLKERVAAQREMLAQTLAALYEAILRLGVAPAAEMVTMSGEINQARDAASRIAGQSRAVEAAVQEVMALGAGG